MNTRLFAIALLVSCALLFTEGRDPTRGGKASATPGADIFLKGDYLELAVNPAGTFGSRAPGPGAGYSYGGSAVPQGYHASPRSSKLGVVVDTGKDGWTVGTPAQSGDAFLEGHPEQGFHVSWHGEEGTFERFNQMPLFEDDDDADYSTAPYRGCVTCKNKETPNTCDPFATIDNCNCNLHTTAENYICDFKRWDIDTESFAEQNDQAGVKKVRWVGIASGKKFESASSGVLVETGEKLKITKDISFQEQSTLIIESLYVENIGTKALYNVTFLWSIAPTLEAFPHAGWSSDKDMKFANIFTTPYQGSFTNPRTLVKAVGKDLGYTLAIGTNDYNARAWHLPRRTWMADQDNANIRPYSGDMVFSTVRTASTEFVLREDVALMAVRIPSLAVGADASKAVFWAFTEADIEEGFNQVPPASPPVPAGSDECPTTGTCCTAHPEQGCSNQCFTECVCDSFFGGNAPECCLGEWTQNCVDILEKLLNNGSCSSGRIGACNSDCDSVHSCTPSVTTGVAAPVTTGVAAPVTTGVAAPVTTGAESVTTGVEAGVTTGYVGASSSGGNPLTGGVTTVDVQPPVTTSDPSQVPDAVNDRNAKIIGAVFGVAGFLILILIIAAIILAVRASKNNK